MSELPKGWVHVPIAELLAEAPCNGLSIRGSDTPPGVPALKLSAMSQYGFDYANVRYLPINIEDVSGLRVLEGDFFVSRGNGSLALVGRGTLAQPAPRDVIFPDTMIRLRLTRPVTDTQWVPAIWASADVRSQIENKAKTTAGIWKVSQTDIAGIVVPLPPIPEQRRIVAKIEALSARSRRAKEALDAIPALLERFRRSVLAAAFRGDLTADWREKNPDVEPAEELLKRIRAERRRRWEEAELAKMRAKGKVPGDDRWKEKYEEPSQVDASNLPELPEGWTWVRAEEVCDFITKGTTPSAEKLSSEAGDVPYIKVYNLTHRGVLDFGVDPTFVSWSTHRGELARSRVFPGDVLMNIVGPPLGKVALVPSYHPEWNINQAIAVFRAVPGLDREFLCNALLSDMTLTRATRQAKATAGQFNLTLEICRDLPLPLAPLSEQEQIVRCISAALQAAGRIEKSIHSNREGLLMLDRAILAKAFRGELVPQDPNDEPASVLLERLRAEREQNGQTTNGAGRRRAAASPSPAPSTPAERGRRPQASRRSQTQARSRG